jgi:large conductance mechanosensitive channel
MSVLVFEDFKRFVARGNMVELAVAFILGVAFATVITSFVNVIMSLVAAIFGASVSFDQLTFTLNGTPIPYGAFLTALIGFLIVAVALFVVIKLYQRLVPPTPDPPTRTCEYCQTLIPEKAVRCPNCTSQLVTAASSPR